MNKEAMLAVADAIEYFDRFDLADVAQTNDDKWEPMEVAVPQLWNNCGTTGCIAGWTLAWADIRDVEGFHKHVEGWHKHEETWKYKARKELGLTIEEADRLFLCDEHSVWAELADEYGWNVNYWGELANWSAVTAAQATEVIRRIVAGFVKL